MSINVTLSTTRHTFHVTAPEGEHFVLEKSDERIAVTRIQFDITTDATGTLRDIGASYIAKGHVLRDDDTLSRVPRTVQGVNLKRIPLIVRLALQEGIRESVGALRDPLGQLDGYDGR